MKGETLGGESRAKFDHFDDIYNSLLNTEPVSQLQSKWYVAPQSRIVMDRAYTTGCFYIDSLLLFAK